MEDSRNLLEETKGFLNDYHLDLDDIVFAFGRAFKITKEDFIELADVEYDPGYGSQEVAEDLTLLLSSGAYLVRDQYDGTEWWEYRYTPRNKIPKEFAKINSLVEEFGGTLEEINGPKPKLLKKSYVYMTIRKNNDGEPNE